MKTIIYNIGTLAGILPAEVRKLEGAQMNNVECIENAYLVIEDGIITEFGQNMPEPLSEAIAASAAVSLASARCSENIEAATVPDPNSSEWSVCPHGAVGDSRLGVNPVPPDNTVIWWNQNWRKGGLQERRLQIIKEYDFYNQLYCGCEFSMRKDV